MHTYSELCGTFGIVTDAVSSWSLKTRFYHSSFAPKQSATDDVKPNVKPVVWYGMVWYGTIHVRNIENVSFYIPEDYVYNMAIWHTLLSCLTAQLTGVFARNADLKETIERRFRLLKQVLTLKNAIIPSISLQRWLRDMEVCDLILCLVINAML